MTCTKPPPGWVCTRTADHWGPCAASPEQEETPTPDITSLPEAERWIGIHQRMLVNDTERMSRIEERLRHLESRPWWRSHKPRRTTRSTGPK